MIEGEIADALQKHADNLGCSPSEAVARMINQQFEEVMTSPITLTIRGNMAAALRLSAYIQDRTPEEDAFDALRSALTSTIAHANGHIDLDAWVMEGVDTKPRGKGSRP